MFGLFFAFLIHLTKCDNWSFSCATATVWEQIPRDLKFGQSESHLNPALVGRTRCGRFPVRLATNRAAGSQPGAETIFSEVDNSSEALCQIPCRLAKGIETSLATSCTSTDKLLSDVGGQCDRLFGSIFTDACATRSKCFFLCCEVILYH